MQSQFGVKEECRSGATMKQNGGAKKCSVKMVWTQIYVKFQMFSFLMRHVTNLPAFYLPHLPGK